MGEPPSCACVQLCQAACCAFAPVHAPCPSPLGEGLEGHLPTPWASLLALCAGGGCLWGEHCSCRQGLWVQLGLWSALGGSLLRPWLKLPCLSTAYVSRCFWPQVKPLGQRLKPGCLKTRRARKNGPVGAQPKSALASVFLWIVPWASLVQEQAGQFSVDAGSLHC